jgi:hypothetical protein
MYVNERREKVGTAKAESLCDTDEYLSFSESEGR